MKSERLLYYKFANKILEPVFESFSNSFYFVKNLQESSYKFVVYFSGIFPIFGTSFLPSYLLCVIFIESNTTPNKLEPPRWWLIQIDFCPILNKTKTRFPTISDLTWSGTQFFFELHFFGIHRRWSFKNQFKILIKFDSTPLNLPFQYRLNGLH